MWNRLRKSIVHRDESKNNATRMTKTCILTIIGFSKVVSTKQRPRQFSNFIRQWSWGDYFHPNRDIIHQPGQLLPRHAIFGPISQRKVIKIQVDESRI